MTTRSYIVTDKAGPKVAGRRVKVGDTIDLSENAARTELLSGVIVEAKSETSTVLEATVETPSDADPAAAETKKKKS